MSVLSRRRIGIFISPTSVTALLLLAAVGCSPNRDTIPQQGQVTLEDQPVAGLMVTFLSVDNKRPAMAETDEQGRFALSTLGEGDGALAGEYKIVVNFPDPTATAPMPGAPPAPPPPAKTQPFIHANYKSVQTTPLRQVIPASGPMLIKLKKDGT